MALTPAERVAAHRARQQEKLARLAAFEEAADTLVERDKRHVATINKLDAALREIIASLADTKTTKGLALRKIAETALADQGKAQV